MATDNYVTDVFFTPDWHWELSSLLGDLTGEFAYITDMGTVRLLGKKNPDLSEYQIKTKTNGPTKSITAKKPFGTF